MLTNKKWWITAQHYMQRLYTQLACVYTAHQSGAAIVIAEHWLSTSEQELSQNAEAVYVSTVHLGICFSLFGVQPTIYNNNYIILYNTYCYIIHILICKIYSIVYIYHMHSLLQCCMEGQWIDIVYLYVIFTSHLLYLAYLADDANDSCCFSETSSSETSCNVSVTLNRIAVRNERIPLQLENTDHNLVCSQSLLLVEVPEGEYCAHTAYSFCGANHTFGQANLM